ncbi:hypothetical protein ILUMI_20147, partial [Ignelater luminosus]
MQALVSRMKQNSDNYPQPSSSHENDTDVPQEVTTNEQQKELDLQVARYIYATNAAFHSVQHPLDDSMVSLSLDGWSNVRKELIVAAWVIDKNGQSYLVNTIDTSGHQHTSEYLEAITSVKRAEELYTYVAGSIVTDNAFNMSSMGNNISQNNVNLIAYGCLAHMLNLLAKDFQMPQATKHVEKIVKYFRNNHFACAKFHELKDGKNLVLPLEIHWNSMCYCLEQYLQQWITLLKVCEDHKDKIDSEVAKIVSNISVKRNAIFKLISIAFTKVEANTIVELMQLYRKNGGLKRPLDYRMEIIRLTMEKFYKAEFLFTIVYPSSVLPPLRLRERHFPEYIPVTDKTDRQSFAAEYVMYAGKELDENEDTTART